MDIRGLGKAYCRTLTGAGLCFKTVTRKLFLFCFFYFWGVGGWQASVNLAVVFDGRSTTDS